jgi:hypothetical protein
MTGAGSGDLTGAAEHPDPADPARGRLVVVTGADPGAAGRLGRALGERLGRAVVVEGPLIDSMVVAPEEPASGTEGVRRLLLRWSASLAVAETYQIEGHDAVIADRIEGDRLEDFLDLAAPEPVRLVVVGRGIDPSTPGWGLWVTDDADLDDPAALAGAADEVVERLAESVVSTA